MLFSSQDWQMCDNVLRSRSYIDGYAPSQGDVKLYKAMGGPPQAGGFNHLRRWYRHIASFEGEFATLPGNVNLDLSVYMPLANPESKGHETPATAANAEEDGDDVDLFGSDDEGDEETTKPREERRQEYQARKAAGKAKPAAKTAVTMDVKPWDDETPMTGLEANVRSIEKDGLVWGRSQLVAVGYGIKKLQINFVVEDEKVSLDELQAEIEEDEDHVQSTDIAAMQKL